MQLSDDQSLFNTVMTAPIGICIMDAATLISQIVNNKFLEVAGKPYEAIYGRFYWDSFAEARPYYEDALAGVVKTGNAYYADEVELMLIRHGKEETIFVTFVYTPIKSDEGKVSKVAVWVLENTTQVAARRQIEKANKELSESQVEVNQLNEELRSTNEELLSANQEGAQINEELKAAYEEIESANEELSATVEELRNTNDSLDASQRNLQLANHRLSASETKLQQAIRSGNMGTWGIDPITRESSTMSDFVKETLGLPSDKKPSMDQIMQAIDIEFHDLVNRTLDEGLTNYTATDIEYTVRNLITKEQRWVRSTGEMFLNAQGEAIEYSGLFIDITNRKLDELRKNDFIGMVSHELKTPITTIKGYLQVLPRLLKGLDNPLLSDVLNKAIRQVDKMTSMINGFLNVSRLESNKLHLDVQTFNLTGLVTEVIEEMALSHSNSDIRFASNDEVLVCSDRDKIGYVINNLISNAFKYSPKSRTVELSCVQNDGLAQFSIKDNGIGIGQDDIEKLFYRYYRVDNKELTYVSGFGIGLYLSAEIINGHKGRIWVESEVGVGSTFYFSIPLGRCE